MLHPGHSYRVTQAFRDYDGTIHPLGEQWTYLGYNFLPYDDGLSLFVSLDGEQEWHIRMQLRPEEQGPIVHDLSLYVVALNPDQPVNTSGTTALPPSNRSTHMLLTASLVALVVGFVILRVSGDGPRLAAPTESSLIGALSGVMVLAGGMLLGLAAVIKLVRPTRIQHKRGPTQ